MPPSIWNRFLDDVALGPSLLQIFASLGRPPAQPGMNFSPEAVPQSELSYFEMSFFTFCTILVKISQEIEFSFSSCPLPSLSQLLCCAGSLIVVACVMGTQTSRKERNPLTWIFRLITSFFNSLKAFTEGQCRLYHLCPRKGKASAICSLSLKLMSALTSKERFINFHCLRMLRAVDV